MNWFAAFGLLIMVLLGGASTINAQSASQIQAQIEEHNAQIQTLRAEIAAYQQEVVALGQQKNTLQSAIDTLTISQKQLGAEISITQNKISSANLELRQLGVQIGDKEATIEVDQAAIAKSLRTVAQNESAPLIAQMITAETLADAWQMAEEVQQLNRALSNHIKDLRMVREALAVDREEVAAAKKRLEAYERDLSLQKRSVDINKSAQQDLLWDTRNKESEYQKLIKEKEAEQAAFEAALFDLESQLQYALDPSKVPPRGKGVLRWPVDDVFITQEFGRTIDSVRLYTSGTHNGVDFRAPVGTPVRAGASGIVVDVNHGAVKYCQYGKWILIEHANGLATLYAHLSDISVSKGQSVLIGEAIGFAGNTGYATGPHLHFGVYIAEALSFRQYTCNSGYSVTIPIAPVNAYLNPLDYL